MIPNGRILDTREKGAHGSYVVICPQEGQLHLTPESPEWLDWLATLSSFRLVGQQGRLSASRKGRPSRRWLAYRTIHQHESSHHCSSDNRRSRADGDPPSILHGCALIS